MTRFSTAALIAIAAITFATPANADRRTALMGNQLIEDKDDVFAYPSLMLDYVNMMTLDYGTSGAQGSGLLVWGSKRMAYGIAVNRTDIGPGPLQVSALDLGRSSAAGSELANLGGPGLGLPSVGGLGAQRNMVDFLIAFASGRNKLGFRVALSNNSTFTKPDNGDETSDSATALKIGGSYSMPGQAFRLVLAGDLAFETAGNVAGGNTVDAGTNIGINVGARGFSRMSSKLDLGFLASLGFGTVNIARADGDHNDAKTQILIMGGAGPVYKVGKATIAGHGIVAIGYASHEPNTEADDDIQTHLNFVFPGIRLSFEAPLIVDWLYFRTGTEYLWAYHSNSTEVGDVTTDREPAPGYGWNAGIGVVIDKLKIDGAFQHAWLTNGPAVLGQQSPMFLIVSATLGF